MSDVRIVYFAFHYADIWEVNQIRNSDQFVARSVAGFKDGSLWEEAKKKGDAALKRLIDDGLQGTSVTICLIGQHTARREWVTYELEESDRRGNLVFGIHLQNQPQRGPVPSVLTREGAVVYDPWDSKIPLGRYIADAEAKTRAAAR